MVTPTVRLVRLLGEGGMGSVWVADHLALKTEVAVKFLLADLVRRSPAMLARFEREASAAARIKSPHVVATFDSGVMEDGTPFIVMELIEGETLTERVGRAGPLSVGETGLLLAQVAKALRKAHKLGIVHRDIKPDNLFLVDSGKLESDGEPVAEELFVKVLDFGIAKQTETANITHTGAMFGTPRFMSPEQLMSTKDVDYRADLWALAVVAYWSLTQRPPFDGETLAVISMAVCQGGFTPPSQLDQSLSPTINAWFARAFDLDAQRRFGSARQMADAFLQAAGGGGSDIADRLSTGDELSHSAGWTPALGQVPSTPETAAFPAGFEVPAGNLSAQPATGAPPTGEHAARVHTLPTPVDGLAPPALQGEWAGQQPLAVQAAALQVPPQASTLGPAASTLDPAGVPRQKWPLFAALGIGAVVVAAGATGVFMTTRGGIGPASSSSDSPAEPTTTPTLTAAEAAPSTSTEPPEATTAEPTAAADSTPAPKPSSRPTAQTKPTAKPKAPKPAPPPKPKTDCNPPYWIDGDGVRRYKPKCL